MSCCDGTPIFRTSRRVEDVLLMDEFRSLQPGVVEQQSFRNRNDGDSVWRRNLIQSETAS